METSNRKKIAVIVAGGIGLRMGAEQPKQFLEIEGRPILIRTLDIFLRSYDDLEVVLVLPKEFLTSTQEMIRELPAADRIRCVAGGATRFQSVQSGLALVEVPSVVFVHDAVRCLLTIDLIQRCYAQTSQLGSAIPAIESKDSIRLLSGDKSQSIDRTQVRLIQTPQTFLSELLLPAFQTEYRIEFTDEASVVEANGQSVHLIEGEARNIKITHPDDLITASHWLRTDQ